MTTTMRGISALLLVAILFPCSSAWALNAQSVSSGTTSATLPLVTAVTQPAANEVQSLQQDLKKKREDLQVIQKQIEIYQKTVTVKQQERLTLQQQLASIEERATSTQLNIKATTQQLAILSLEIDSANKKIADLAKKQDEQRVRLGSLLKLIRQDSERNPLELFLVASSFSQAYDSIAAGEQLNRSLLTTLDNLKKLSADAAAQKAELEARIAEQTSFQKTLIDQKAKLEEDRAAKDFLVATTQESEKKYQQFLESARTEEEQANTDIQQLDQEIKKKLESQPETRNKLGVGEHVPLIWPVPFAGIATTFHDPSYPFRRIFEHPGLDLRTLKNGVSTNGMPIHAAASGFVGRARDAGMGYSYIMLVHSDRLSTVYGHVSKILVNQEQYVNQGDVIGLSGGLPGTPGAGRLTTGPHLHFEVRLDGIPVNPLNYLPTP